MRDGSGKILRAPNHTVDVDAGRDLVMASNSLIYRKKSKRVTVRPNRPRAHCALRGDQGLLVFAAFSSARRVATPTRCARYSAEA